MALKFRKKVLLVKIQPTANTDAVPTGAANAIEAQNVEIDAVVADKIKRELTRDYLGSAQDIHVGAHVMIDFDVELTGAGTAGDAPLWGPCLRACAMAETITAGTDVQYDPVSASEEMVTIYFFMDGQKHALTDARGTWGLKMSAKGIPMLHFQIVGLWVDPAAVANPSADYSGFENPLPVTKANTPTASLHAYAVKMGNFEINQNNTLAYRNLVGVEEVAVTDRDFNGTISIEAPALGSHNYFTAIKGDTVGALQIIHGTAAGGIIQIDAPVAQLDAPKYVNEDGVTMLQMAIGLKYSTGDDEIKLTVK